MNPQSEIPAAGLISRNAHEIGRILESLHKKTLPIETTLGSDDLIFRSQLLYVDPAQHYIVVAAAASKSINTALLSHPRVTFVSEFSGWHVEFAASDPQIATVAGKAAIRLRFPDVIVTQRRQDPRAAVPSSPPLRCVADAHGVAPFDAHIVEVSRRGIAFLLYTSAITLEPGTVLKGCRIEGCGSGPIDADLEVRYSAPVVLPDGSHAHRSGCVFLNPTREITELIESFLPAGA